MARIADPGACNAYRVACLLRCQIECVTRDGGEDRGDRIGGDVVQHAVLTCSQFGYAAGVFLLVPLGDRLRHRRLVTTLLLLTTAGLVLAGTAATLPTLAVASALIGMTTVVPQILIPIAAGLVEPERRGEVTGTLVLHVRRRG